MNKLAFASLGLLALLSAAGTTQASGGSADLGLDLNRLYFAYQAPSGNLDVLHMTPNTEHNPLLLPCDVTLFGGQLDIDYPGAGPTVYPRVSFSLFTESGASMAGSGCTGIPLGTLPMDVAAMTAGTVQSDGYTPFAAPPAPFCAWQYQPSNLPADQPVRMHMVLSASADAAHTQPVSDPNPDNNTTDIWVKRECSCL